MCTHICSQEHIGWRFSSVKADMNIFLCTHIFVNVYIYTYFHIYTHICVHAHIHTYQSRTDRMVLLVCKG